jgi:hypothetical protein
MALIRASEAGLDLPAIGFLRDGARTFPDPESLRECEPSYYADGDLIGIELVDNSLRRWVVRSVVLLTPLPVRRWWHIRWLHILLLPFIGGSIIDIDPELEEIDPITFEEVRSRVLAEEEVYDLPSDGEPSEFVMSLRKARDLAEIVSHLDGDRLCGLLE